MTVKIPISYPRMHFDSATMHNRKEIKREHLHRLYQEKISDFYRVKKDDFDKIHQNRKFNMRIFNMNSKMSENSKIEITRISKDYQDTKTNASNIGALFNSSNFLEIFMRQSNLAQLLSIVMNYNIKIDFYD
jgi:S-adenosylmethionine hydrolase